MRHEAHRRRPDAVEESEPQMLNFPLWKRILVLGICLLGIVVALPNVFYGRVERANDARAARRRAARR